MRLFVGLTLVTITLLATSTVFGSPKITSVMPPTGPVTGGTIVIIRGTGFSNNCIICSPPFGEPEVFFGGERVLSVKFIDETTVEAVTPPHLPQVVGVRIVQLDGSDPNFDILENAFTYQGDVYDAFDPVLFPIYMRPVQGAFGSEFRTTARVFNQSFSGLLIHGIDDRTCNLIHRPLPPNEPVTLEPRAQEVELPTNCSETIGRIFLVPNGRDKDLAGNIRVWETTRQTSSHGVEIPVVHRSEFSEETISLLGVPIDPRFRNTLRIYGLKRGQSLVNVTINGKLHQLPLEGPSDVFTPAITTFTDFPLPHELPAGQKTVTVTIDVPRGPGGAHIPGTPVWAFISVTNNETQEITAITPN